MIWRLGGGDELAKADGFRIMNALGAADPRPVHCQYSEAEPLFPLLEGPLAQFPALPLWTDAYLGDTGHLTTLEHGAYFLLLITMWRNKGSLPDDDAMLCRYARLTKTQWLRIRPIIIEFFDVENGRITQGRLTDEYDAVRQHSKNQSKKAKARWLKEKKTVDAVAPPRQCPADASPSLTLTPIDSVPNGTGAARAVDPAKLVFDQGLKWLTSYDIPSKQARALVGKWRKRRSDPELLLLLVEAGRAERSNPIEYIEGCLKNGKSGSNPDRTAARRREMLKGLEDAGRLDTGLRSAEGHNP